MSYGYDDGYGESKSDRVQRSLDDYVDVAARIEEFRAKYPDGRLRPADPFNPVKIVYVSGIDKQGNEVKQTFVEYTALCYRSPDDDLPGVGVAWEHFPGLTPYTRNSEAQNAETSAWGRAIVAALVADARAGVSSREEVRNRQAERQQEFQEQRPQPNMAALDEILGVLFAATNKQEMSVAWQRAGQNWLHDVEIPGRDPGFKYRDLWKERMDQLNAEMQRSAGLGEETGEPEVAPNQDDGQMEDAARQVVEDRLEAEQVQESPEVSGE